jgi:hypothetical protein
MCDYFSEFTDFSSNIITTDWAKDQPSLPTFPVDEWVKIVLAHKRKFKIKNGSIPIIVPFCSSNTNQRCRFYQINKLYHSLALIQIKDADFTKSTKFTNSQGRPRDRIIKIIYYVYCYRFLEFI